MKRLLALLPIALAACAASTSRAAGAADPGAESSARLDYAASLNGALDRPAKLAQLCLDARLACGFELRADAWKRPEAQRRIPSATVGQALTIFIGKDYRLDWREGVLLVTPAAPGLAPLDAEVSADVRENGPADPNAALRAVARRIGLRLSAVGKAPRRPSPAAAGAALPTTSPARDALALWNRPAQAHPNVWIAVYSRDGRSGKLYWFWGESRRFRRILGRLRSGQTQLSGLMSP